MSVDCERCEALRAEVKATRLALKDLALIAVAPLFREAIGKQINPHPGNLAFAAIEAASKIRATGVSTGVADDMVSLLLEHYRDQLAAEPQDLTPGKPAG